jgi:hypothetical protein
MSNQNFYAKIKEKSTKKVEKKVKEKEAEAPFDATDADVYVVGTVNVFRPAGLMPTWVQGGQRYHLNVAHSVKANVYHVTLEGSPKIHYWFESTESGIVAKQPQKKERGSASGTHETLDDLPDDVRAFVSAHWLDILG